jgi:hypothetical protein
MSVVTLRGGVTRNALAGLERLTRSDRAGLGAVLAIQAALSLRLTNTAFEDEALYIYAGHQQIAHLLHGAVVYDNFSYLSGFPWFYPPIAGFLDGVGGLELVRLFSLACLLAATLAVAGIARQLFGSRTALPSAAVFALAGPVLFLSHLATYDALTIALLAGATLVAVSPHRGRFVPALLVGALLALAFLAKYVALLFAPSILVLALVRGAGSGPQVRARLTIVAGIGIGAVALLALVLVPLAIIAPEPMGEFVAGFIGSTLSRQGQVTVATTEILGRAALLQGPTLAIAAAGAVIAVTRRRHVGALLLATGLLPVAYHALSHELTSLHKHVAFGIVFLAPLAGLAAATMLDAVHRDPRGGTSLMQKSPRRKGAPLGTSLVGVVLIAVLYAGIGMRTSAELFAEWSNSSNFVRALLTQVRPASGRYLVEESEVPRYYLSDIVSPWQWAGTFFFQYTTRSGVLLTGVDAYHAALRDRYFDLVALRYGPTAALDRDLYNDLRNPRLYALIARVPVGPGQSDWFIWRRV